MNHHPDDARAGLEEIAKRRNQVIDGASRGRHRGWDAAGMLAMIAGFAAMDLPIPSEGVRLGLLGVATVVALTCFTRAGHRSGAVMHRSQINGRFWAVLGGLAVTAGALGFAGALLLGQVDLPLRYTFIGVALVVFIAATEPLYRALLRRATA